MRRKGELSPASIDRGWPHQVALPASASQNGGYKVIHEFCKSLSLCPRGHSVFRLKWFNIYCFADRADAEKFLAKFGGQWFDPTKRGKGARWAQWPAGAP
jgi:hypothetical protein